MMYCHQLHIRSPYAVNLLESTKKFAYWTKPSSTRKGRAVSTYTLEEYLEAIYKISERGPVRPTMIAEAVKVSGPTVTATLKRLESRGLITRAGSEVVLTEDGLRLALDIIRRHRISERFLVDILGLPWAEAHEEACKLEHALSPKVLKRLEDYLDSPDVCPHGHPIPSECGSIDLVEAKLLSTYSVGSRLRISRVEEDDEELLAHLGSLGMYPGAEVEITDSAPFDGPITIAVDGKPHVIGSGVARAVYVTQE